VSVITVILVLLGVVALIVLMGRSGAAFGVRSSRERDRVESERDLTAYTERGGHRQDPPELRKPPNEDALP
jgi:hypothetical protein